MKLFQKHSLIRKLYILFAMTMLTTLGTSLIFYNITFHSIKNEKSQNMESTTANLIQNTEDIANSVMLMAETISNTSYTYAFLTETNTVRKISYQQLLNRLVTRLIKSTSHINNILLLDNDENIHSFSSFDYNLASRLEKQYHILTPGTYPDGFTGALYLSDTDTTYYAYIQTIYENSNASSKQKIGTCVIICYCSPLNNLCNNSASSEQALFAILDSDNQMLACNQKAYTSYQELADIDSKDHLILQYQSLPLTNWKFFCSVPYTELYSELSLIQYLATLLMIVPFLAFLLLAYQLNTGVVSPIIKIVGFFQKGPYYILHNHLDVKVKGKNEITTLTTNINQMLNEINELTHTVLQNQSRLYEIKLSKDQAQILALQTQINPHFLYNTLNSIQGLAYQGKCEEICTAVTALSYMMRYNINGSSMTQIKNEFLCIEKYLQIINLRFPNRFQFHLSMDEGIGDYEMPRFLLQPLLENAISHGLEPRFPQKGTLTLTASLNSNSILHFECRDDGVGIPPDKLQELRQKLENATTISAPQPENRSGIGLLNIHMRIRLIYGVPFGLSVNSSPEGTTICADFPARVPTKSVQTPSG